MSRLRILLLVTLLTPALGCAQQAAPSAAALFRQGDYAAAIDAAERQLAADASRGDAAVVLLRALTRVGRASEAASRGASFSRQPALAPLVAVALGSAYRAMGRLTEAEQAYRQGLRGAEALRARYELAALRFARGETEQALTEFDAFIDVYNRNRAQLTGSDLRAVALAVRMLGRRDPQLFKDALRAFDEASARDTTELDGRVELAEMLLEKFSYAEARKELAAVVAVNARHPEALQALARLEAGEGAGDGAEHVKQSLEVNPSSPRGRAQAAIQLIDVERYAEAIAEARLGLAVDSGAPEPWVAISAAAWLAGDRALHTSALATAHRRLAGSATAEVTLADIAARNRLYREAAEFAAAGVARDSLSARALALLGINLMRTGDVPTGVARLQRAFALDPYDVWVKNTLDLADTFTGYTELRSRRFVVSVEKKDAALLEQFAVPLAEQAYDSLQARYGVSPAPPVRVEFFRSHADFSVRTVGLNGLGALGVSFGNVIAMDSPAARKVGEFNWGSTLWHELTHTFTLGASGNRVPRWVSEGLSVYEERRARPGWGSDVTPTLIAAYKGDRLQPVSRLNNGFVRPRYPEEVQLSYALASFVCEMLEQDHGIAGIRRLLSLYREGKTTEQAFAEVTKLSPDAMDKKFDTWFRARFAAEFKVVEPVKANEGENKGNVIRWEGPLYDAMRQGTTAVAGEQWDAAIASFERAKALFPAWTEGGSAYHMLAAIHEKRGTRDAELRELSAIAARNESAFEENVRLAALLRRTGDHRGAVAALERTRYITPFVGTVHDSLASAAKDAVLPRAVVDARRALLALNPTDQVEALYLLAQALADAGDVSAARREVLRALDLAPNYERAQQLLLSLRKPEGGP